MSTEEHPDGTQEFHPEVMDPGLFNLWLRGEAPLWFDGRELVVLARPGGPIDDAGVYEQHPELFQEED